MGRGLRYIDQRERGADLMTSLSEHPQNASPVSQDVMDAIWGFEDGIFPDTTPPIKDEHKARFQRLVLNIHKQLFQTKKIQPRKKIQGRRAVRVRARRSPASLRRATADSGGDPDPEPRRPYSSLPVYRGGAV